MPKVSIVMPVYNVEKYLRQCMDSILNQTLADIEVICVNDGSKDNSPAILQEYAAKDKRVKVINKTNSGYGHSMNVGIDASTGEYLGIVEPDDYILPGMYEDLYKNAIASDADIVKGDFYRFVDGKNGVERTYFQLSKLEKYYHRIIDPGEEPAVFKFIMNTWSGIYKLDFLRAHNIRHNETPGASFQDNGFWFQGFCRSHKVMFIDRPYYMNRRDNPNSSVKDKTKVYCANVEYEYIKNFLIKNDLYEKFKYVYAMKAWHNYWFTYNRIDKKFKSEYLKSISKDLRWFFDKNEIEKSYFSKNELRSMRLISRHPMLFHYAYRVVGRLRGKLK